MVFLSKHFIMYLSSGKGCPKSIFSHHKQANLNLPGINVEGCHLLRMGCFFFCLNVFPSDKAKLWCLI